MKACVAEAKLLFPQHEEVLMLDAEAVASEGQFDEALSMMDVIVSASDPSDTMSKIIKANILMQKVPTYPIHHITSDLISSPVINSYHITSCNITPRHKVAHQLTSLGIKTQQKATPYHPLCSCT